MNDKTFVELLGISQSLPGLKAVNLAVLIGDSLRGTFGAIAALAGVCLPGALLMYVVGLVYQVERERPLLEAGLEGVAAAAAGLVLAMTLQLGRQALSGAADLIFVVLTVICVNRLNVPVPYALAAIGALAVGWYAWVDAASTRVRR
jgi:chromate transporter